MHTFAPIEEFVPHRGAMLLVSGVLACDTDSITVGAAVPREAWYLDEQGAMPAWIGLELMAQAIAAHAGVQGRVHGGRPRRGLLLGCRAYHAAAPSFAAGAALEVSAQRAATDEGGFAAFDCTVRSAGRELASATVRVFVPPEVA
jgi:predicted hotdog family 3-hydroxylacyl-ACP dehydratase